ncbi:MAG TPA: hypothetical protein VJW96_11425 [Terriglobales bacterium]|nr:hypothetical protein [Terriglobales bacterium]
MRASRRFLAVALVCLSNFCLSNFCLSSFAAAQQSDQVVAERVLGPQWKQLSRRAGMIFAGTVLATAPPTATAQTAAIDRVVPGKAPSVELRFQVDKAITGVEPGQVLTIHEWAGAWSTHRAMSKGQHVLIFLYPPSRLGLTSPVGGSMGQVALDPSGENVSEHGQKPAAATVLRHESSPRPLAPVVNGSVSNGSVSVVQLERAIRSARGE